MRMRTKVFLGFIGFLILIPTVVWIVGSRLPQDHVATVEARFEASPSEVWTRIADPVASADWRPGIKEVERLPDRDGLPAFREHTSMGSITYVLETREEERLLVTRIVDNTDFGGRWVYELRPDGTGTHLTIREHGEIYNTFFRFMAQYVFGMDGTLKHFLADLTRELEAEA